MNSPFDSPENSEILVIELGYVTSETKGSQTPFLPDEVGGQYMKMPGIAQD